MRYQILALTACVFMLSPDLGAQPITVGAAGTMSDAPLYIANKKGYFRQNGLDIKLVNFSSTSDMTIPIRAGQIQAGGAAVSAGLFNAIVEGMRIKIVADKGSSIPGYSGIKFLVRKDHIDTGRYKRSNLKKMMFAVSGPGGSDMAALNALLNSAGLKYSTEPGHSDISVKYINAADHATAFERNLIDASASVEPSATEALKEHGACLIGSDDKLLPNHQIAVLFYSEEFALTRRSDAKKFMHAYMQGVQFYIGALQNGGLEGPNANELVSVLAKATSTKPLSDAAYRNKQEKYKAIAPIGINPDGRVNKQSIADDLVFYREHGFLKDGNALNIDDIIDNSFVEAVQHSPGNRLDVVGGQHPFACRPDG